MVPEIEYEITRISDGEFCASTDDLGSAKHYLAIYGQDEPTQLHRVTKIKELIDQTT